MNLPLGHIVRAYDEELTQLTLYTNRMGSKVEELLSHALRSLHTRDNDLAAATYEADNAVDALEVEVNDQILQILALRQPMALDLRLIVGSMRIARDLERIGDYAANFAKRTYYLNSQPRVELTSTLLRLGNLVMPILGEALQSYAERSIARADAACAGDDAVDMAYEELFTQTIQAMEREPNNAASYVHILFMGKNIERIGDRATNIAETVHFIVHGYLPREPRRPNIAATLKTKHFPSA
ncbi:MAG: phosphate signaling complex protein PhoU [Holosporales bacterium]|jgi:phosphate transport system protein